MKTVIEMAREATLLDSRDDWNSVPDEYQVAINAFAELVRADMKERCAKVCDQLAIEDGLHQAKYCANAIRGGMDE